jgi:hypothetical protein
MAVAVSKFRQVKAPAKFVPERFGAAICFASGFLFIVMTMSPWLVSVLGAASMDGMETLFIAAAFVLMGVGAALMDRLAQKKREEWKSPNNF